MPGVIRRGKAAIDEASKSSGRGGDFKPFIKSIYWKDDGDERYVLFLTPMEESPQFDMIEFIPTDRGYPETMVAKTDPYFGERSDPFETEWDATPRTKNIAVAVELEPLIEVVNGRSKAKNFEVKIEEFSRKIVDEDSGEVTDETEDVTAPAVGVVTQSPSNFFNVLKSCDDTDWPVHETAVRVKRVGKDSKTTYKIDGYDTQEIDLTNLLEYVEGISYLGDDLDDVLEKIEGVEPLEAAYIIGNALIERRMAELLDEERYEELLGGVHESMDKFGSKKEKKSDKKSERKATRSARPSQRRKAEPVEEDTPEPAVTRASNPHEKLDEIRKRGAAKKTK